MTQNDFKEFFIFKFSAIEPKNPNEEYVFRTELFERKSRKYVNCMELREKASEIREKALEMENSKTRPNNLAEYAFLIKRIHLCSYFNMHSVEGFDLENTETNITGYYY